MKIKYLTLLLALGLCITACGPAPTIQSSDSKDAQRSEVLLNEASAEIGLPRISHFREKKLLKDIYEMRDDNLITYTYLISEYTGKLVYLGQSIGFGLPYSTQFTSSQKLLYVKPANSPYTETRINGSNSDYHVELMPQAEPNGLFVPSSAEGTWIILLNPVTHKAEAQYIEPRIAVFTFKLPDDSPALAK